MIIVICPSCHRELEDVDSKDVKLTCPVCGTAFLRFDGIMSSVRFKDHHGGKSAKELFDEAVKDFISLGSEILVPPMYSLMIRSALVPEGVGLDDLSPIIQNSIKAALTTAYKDLADLGDRRKAVDVEVEEGEGNGGKTN